MGELDSPCGPVIKRGVDVGNLKPQSALVRHHGRSNLLKEDREVAGVLERDRLPVWDLELNLEAKRANVPVATPSQLGHRDPEVVDLDHGSFPPTLDHLVYTGGQLGRGPYWACRARS